MDSCGCAAGFHNDGWEIDPSALNIGLTLAREISSGGLDFTQWESGYPIGFVGALRHYWSLPADQEGPCRDTWIDCRVGPGGCSETAIACEDACMGDTGCIQACLRSQKAFV